MTPEQFVEKWEAVTASEHAAAQSHFNDLCRLLDVPTPLEADPAGENYAFEKHVKKAARGKGFADAWKRGAFAWEYKTKGRDLGDAYRQLLLYRDDLDNPPLLVVSDINSIEVHTNFTGTTKAVHTYSLDDLRDPVKRQDLRLVWTNPRAFDPKQRRERVTEDATREISRIALSLRDRGHDPEEVAHFMMQLVFAMFAEDMRLLPNRVLTKILERAQNPGRVQDYLTQLFEAMTTGGEVLLEDVDYFNGGLFDGTPALPLTAEEIQMVHRAAEKDWTAVEPAIFGTLFERSLDPDKRGQLGAHYTSRDDILRIIEPVILEPLRAQWNEIRATAEEFLANPAEGRGAKQKRIRAVEAPVTAFLSELHNIQVLDPACGSGNFLYVALQVLKDLEHEVVTFAEQVGIPGMRFLSPKQLHGIEINPFARELASMVVWIGYLQWNRANGISNAQRPILEPLENIRLHDALMNDDGTEYEWPEADFIVGNPPFLGNRRMRLELGDSYVERLRHLFGERISNNSDLVCYWFEKARAQIADGEVQRAGLIATNSIRGGANRQVLERIKETGGIFMAWADEPWILDGAAVRVSIIAFDDGTETTTGLNGKNVANINADLTSRIDLSPAQRLPASQGKSFMGVKKVGAFDIPGDLAREWLNLPNPSGVNNADVVRPTANGMDLLRRSRDIWTIDFAGMPLEEARQYAVPMAYVESEIRPYREQGRDRRGRTYWWQHLRYRPEMRAALAGQARYLATSAVAKHRVFAWLPIEVLADGALFVFATDDDYTFGVLHSRIHEVWALAQGTSLGVGNDPRYTPSTCFETFPFPDATPEQRDAVAAAAKHLDAVRNHLLQADEKLTMTNLYNELVELKEERDSTARAFPLLLAHESLDEAVAGAYGWEWPLVGEEILERLLALNLAQAGQSERAGA